VSRFTVSLSVLALLALMGCAPDYSPDVYTGNAVQQANKVERGTIIGYRQVTISGDGTIGAVSGGATGGVLGSQAGIHGVSSALGAVGGTLLGGIVGSTIESVADKTTGWEYIVATAKGALVSVTQREPAPLPIGQKVLVIDGKQARIVPDYTHEEPQAAPPAKPAAAKPAPQAAPSAPAQTESI
jgi:outer membrane lipoprotein SlyB